MQTTDKIAVKHISIVSLSFFNFLVSKVYYIYMIMYKLYGHNITIKSIPMYHRPSKTCLKILSIHIYYDGIYLKRGSCVEFVSANYGVQFPGLAEIV